MKRQHRSDEALAEQAAGWLHALERGDAQDQAAFAAWLKESPRHVEEVLCAAAVSKTLHRLDAQHWPDVSKHLANPSGTIIPLSADEAARPATRGTGRRWTWLSAAAAVVVCTSVWWFLHEQEWKHYSTAIGEQRALTLDDGSLAHMNTHSQLDVRFTPSTREIRLTSGEALFKVEHDPARPFVVRTGDALIRALGTQFNVYRRTNGTTVAVIEGLVEVSTERGSAQLLAGEEARVIAGAVTRVEASNTAEATAWRQRRLVFELDPLAEVAEEFNRYNRAPHIRVEGEAARAKRFSGVFDADDPQSLTKLLATYGDLTVEDSGGEIVIRRR